MERSPLAPVLRMQRFCSHGSKGLIGESQFDVLEPEELLVLLDESILRLQEYTHESFLVQLVQCGRYRQSAHELGYQAVVDQVFRLNVSENVRHRVGLGAADLSVESHGLHVHPLMDDFVQTHKRSAAYKENIRRIDLEEFLLRMFTSALGGNIGHCAFNNFQKGLLDPLTGNVSGNARIFRFAGDLVDFIYIDYAATSAGDVIIRVLQEASE